MSYEPKHPITVGDGFRFGIGHFLAQAVLLAILVGACVLVLVAFGIPLAALAGER